jgi:hypothetical protein
MAYRDLTNRRTRADVARLLRGYRRRIQRYQRETPTDELMRQVNRRMVEHYRDYLSGARELLAVLYD